VWKVETHPPQEKINLSSKKRAARDTLLRKEGRKHSVDTGKKCSGGSLFVFFEQQWDFFMWWWETGVLCRSLFLRSPKISQNKFVKNVIFCTHSVKK
jgi:hypothetical protein